MGADILRAPTSDAEIAAAAERLEDARTLMISALDVLDGTPVATDCDAQLDHAIHLLGEAIQKVNAGHRIFRVTPTLDLPKA